MKEKIISNSESRFILLHILKLLTNYDISYNLHETLDEQYEVTFNVARKEDGREISGLIFCFVDNHDLNIESFFPNLNLQKDSKGLSAALAYLLMAFYGACFNKNPLQKIVLRADKSVAEIFWLKLKGLNLVKKGQSPLNKDYYDYEGTFPEAMIKNIYQLALTSIKRAPSMHPFLKIKPLD
ncbi:MAG: hypothetical protein WCH76_04555 [Candidatus Riflemargulisbacteria bacterium]